MSIEWKHIRGFYQRYSISSDGQIYSHFMKKRMKLQIREKKDNYVQIGLTNIDGKQKYYLVHRLVAKNFIKKDLSEKDFIGHKDGNPQNNRVSNLQMGKKYQKTNQRTACIRKKRRKNGIKYIGHFYDQNKNQVYTGSFDSIEQAIKETEAKIIQYGLEIKKKL